MNYFFEILLMLTLIGLGVALFLVIGSALDLHFALKGRGSSADEKKTLRNSAKAFVAVLLWPFILPAALVYGVYRLVLLLKIAFAS